MTEKWYYSKILKAEGKKPNVNENASIIRKLIWVNIAVALFAALNSEGELIPFVLLFFLFQMFFLQILYLWVKFEVGFHTVWIARDSTPIQYWDNIGIISVVYTFLSVLPLCF